MILNSALLQKKKKQCQACCNNRILVLTKNFLQYTILFNIFETPETSWKSFTNCKSLSNFFLKEPLRGAGVIKEFWQLVAAGL